ncbi:MAG: hypothetical protein JXB47_03100 [Anaerolineae bacterium]|nr:hypothetical protein [Anaerolineae bacterium]
MTRPTNPHLRKRYHDGLHYNEANRRFVAPAWDGEDEGADDPHGTDKALDALVIRAHAGDAAAMTEVTARCTAIVNWCANRVWNKLNLDSTPTLERADLVQAGYARLIEMVNDSRIIGRLGELHFVHLLWRRLKRAMFDAATADRAVVPPAVYGGIKTVAAQLRREGAPATPEAISKRLIETKRQKYGPAAVHAALNAGAGARSLDAPFIAGDGDGDALIDRLRPAPTGDPLRPVEVTVLRAVYRAEARAALEQAIAGWPSERQRTVVLARLAYADSRTPNTDAAGLLGLTVEQVVDAFKQAKRKLRKQLAAWAPEIVVVPPGVNKNPNANTWVARVWMDGKGIYVGSFKTIAEAVTAREAALAAFAPGAA